MLTPLGSQAECGSADPGAITHLGSSEVKSPQLHLTLEIVQSTWWAPSVLGCCGDSPKGTHSSSQLNPGIPLSSVLVLGNNGLVLAQVP